MPRGRGALEANQQGTDRDTAVQKEDTPLPPRRAALTRAATAAALRCQFPAPRGAPEIACAAQACAAPQLCSPLPRSRPPAPR
jgi:hypothetical protein